ncbi:MAG TPA: S9 family peptidase [Acidobacteriaceae bacterium]|jgi:dipeptidyl aminopeptidase/acylaminoacyl peptidase|nr:S9 family peptidase [Acidobacteriaceae bacterium]
MSVLRFVSCAVIATLSALGIAQTNPASGITQDHHPATAATPTQQRLMTVADTTSWHDVRDPQVSPDGQWVAYAVSSVDAAADKHVTTIWMVSWDGGQDIQLTRGPESSSSPRWSPDGKYLAFTSSRPGKAKGTQVWLLDRRGGEARQLTGVKDHLSSYAWSPDSKKLLLTLRAEDAPTPSPKQPDVKAPETHPAPKPIVIDRYHFKEDVEGYLTGNHQALLYLYDIQSGKLDKLTTDTAYDEQHAVWSPDGTHIAFTSDHDKDWDRTNNSDVFVVAAVPHSTPRKLTTFDGPDGGRIAWSPDSKSIAYLQGSEPRYEEYSQNKLAIVGIDGSAPRLLTAKLDRDVSTPLFSPDGKIITVLETNDRLEYPVAVDVQDGSVHRLLSKVGVAFGQNAAANHVVLLWSTDAAPAEIYAFEGGELRKLTSQNDALVAQIKLGQTRNIDFHSKDGTAVNGLLTLPPDYQAGTRYPTLLRIHGGPNGQDEHAFSVERQLFAANGYAVINVNYRGSSGRGHAYAQSIFADWGNREVADLLAGVDYVVDQGIADPNRLGVGGWSYGGILTDYTIASDGRFKAAISGAGTGNVIGLYGVDEYVFQYDNELGPPWKNPALWVKLSYPFFKADHIHTPTLFMGGTKDFNVPLVAGEQMYEALRSLNVPTELVIYPGQFHGFTRPSYIRDRYQRYLNWYGKYVKNPAPETAKE